MRQMISFLATALGVLFFAILGGVGERVYDGATFSEVFPPLILVLFLGSLSLAFTLISLSYDLLELKDEIRDLKPAKQKHGEDPIAG